MWNYYNPVEIIFGEKKFSSIESILENKKYIIVTHPKDIFKQYRFKNYFTKEINIETKEIENEIKNCYKDIMNSINLKQNTRYILIIDRSIHNNNKKFLSLSGFLIDVSM